MKKFYGIFKFVKEERMEKEDDRCVKVIVGWSDNSERNKSHHHKNEDSALKMLLLLYCLFIYPPIKI